MAAEQLEPRELYDPEQVRRVVENVEDPETKAILYLAWETALTATEISSLPARARESCAAAVSGDQVGSISKKYATKRLKALKYQECLVAIFEKLVALLLKISPNSLLYPSAVSSLGSTRLEYLQKHKIKLEQKF